MLLVAGLQPWILHLRSARLRSAWLSASIIAFGSGSASVGWLRSPSHHGGDKWGILTTDGSMGGCLGANPLYVNRVAFGFSKFQDAQVRRSCGQHGQLGVAKTLIRITITPRRGCTHLRLGRDQA